MAEILDLENNLATLLAVEAATPDVASGVREAVGWAALAAAWQIPRNDVTPNAQLLGALMQLVAAAAKEC